jgi:hypothetical protein
MIGTLPYLMLQNRILPIVVLLFGAGVVSALRAEPTGAEETQTVHEAEQIQAYLQAVLDADATRDASRETVWEIYRKRLTQARIAARRSAQLKEVNRIDAELARSLIEVLSRESDFESRPAKQARAALTTDLQKVADAHTKAIDRAQDAALRSLRRDRDMALRLSDDVEGANALQEAIDLIMTRPTGVSFEYQVLQQPWEKKADGLYTPGSGEDPLPSVQFPFDSDLRAGNFQVALTFRAEDVEVTNDYSAIRFQLPFDDRTLRLSLAPNNRWKAQYVKSSRSDWFVKSPPVLEAGETYTVVCRFDQDEVSVLLDDEVVCVLTRDEITSRPLPQFDEASIGLATSFGMTLMNVVVEPLE